MPYMIICREDAQVYTGCSVIEEEAGTRLSGVCCQGTISRVFEDVDVIRLAGNNGHKVMSGTDRSSTLGLAQHCGICMALLHICLCHAAACQ